MKIAICIPVHRDPKVDFMTSLSRVLIRAPKALPEVQLEVFVRASSMIAYGRNLLVGFAREWGADYILWADDDHAFPPDSLARLVAHGRPVVGCNFLRRGGKPATNAYRGDKMVWTTRAKAEAGEVEEVDSLGLGLCLMSLAALEGLPEPLFDTELSTLTGEDVILCRKLRAAGVKICVDHKLSWESRHITDFGLGFHMLQDGKVDESRAGASDGQDQGRQSA